MKKEGELWRAASQLVANCRHAVITTADANGIPHAAWMNILADSQLNDVITITAPDTQKVANVRANPRVEWMCASDSMETVVYVSGPAEILEGDEAKRYWDAMPGKYRAYFWQYINSVDHRDFAVIRTKIEKVVYCRPQGYHKTLVYES
jgi:general stress protein 26